MKKKKNWKETFFATFFCILTAAMITTVGCTAVGNNSVKTSEQTVGTEKESTAVYYDFKDVMVPEVMKIDHDATVIISTPGFTSGVLALKGRASKTSLFNFFRINMMKDNWNIVSQIKSPKTTIQVFQKAQRWAVINIRENELYTYVEIGVAPSLDAVNPGGSGSGQEASLFD